VKLSRRVFLSTTISAVAGSPFLIARKGGIVRADSAMNSVMPPTQARLNPYRLEALDLRRFIRLGVEHIYRGAIDSRRGYLPFVGFGLTEGNASCNHVYWGSPHMEGRFLDALARCAEVVDVPADDAAIDGLRTWLHRSLSNPWGLPLWNLPDPDGKQTGNMHDCREVLLGLVALARWRKCEHSKELARGLVQAMEKATRATGGYPSSVLGIDGWRLPAEPGVVNFTCGRAIGALTDYYRFAQNTLALDLARRFADYCIKNAFTSEGDLSDGAGSHLHSSTGTMASLLDLGVLTNDERYVAFGRKLYDVFLKPYRTSFGWAKERKDPWPHRGEANNTGDYIEAAITLAQNGYPEYYADAERFVRNGLLAAQIINVDWIVQSDEPDTEDLVHSHIRERVRGGFAFTTPNGYHSYNTDLMGGALRALCRACEASIQQETGRLVVNMLFPVDTPAIVATTQLPQAGVWEACAKIGGTLEIRLMEGMAANGIRLTVNGESRDPGIRDGVLFAENLPADARVLLECDLPARHTNETPLGWDNCEIDWRGNTIVAMTPSQGGISLY